MDSGKFVSCIIEKGEEFSDSFLKVILDAVLVLLTSGSVKFLDCKSH